MRRQRANAALAGPHAMELESLDAWLEQLKPAPKVDGVSMLDGYLE